MRGSGAPWWEISLPVSDDSHKDIEVYFRNNFARIQQRYSLSSGVDRIWPSESEIKALVEKSAGLFIYAATIVRFFDDPTLPEREQQLSDLLYPKPQTVSPTTKAGVTPLSHLDAFYAAIMRRISPHHLPYTLTVLLILSSELFTGDLTLTKISNLLGYSISTIHSAIYALHSVLFLRKQAPAADARVNPALNSAPTEQIIGFYHYSFVEFLRDPTRSGEFYVLQHSCQTFWASRCLQILSEFSKGGDLLGIKLREPELHTPDEARGLRASMLMEASYSVLATCARITELHDQPDLITQLYMLDFQKIVAAVGVSKQHLVMCIREEELRGLREQLSRYTQNQPWSRRMPRLIRERLQVMNIMTQQYHNLKYKLDAAISERTNSFGSTSSSTSYTSLRSGSSATPSTPSRVLPAYELGQQGKVVYLYPERSASGITYHVCTNLDDLNEPYVFSDVDES